jgi:conjugal transfer mating pair stabilization protein TraN
MTPAHNFPRLCLIGLVTFLLSGASAWAADCRLDSVVCKEGLASDSHYVAGQTTIMPCKTFAGESACLTDIGQTCWGNRKTYTCIKPNSVNYCQPFIDAQPQCWQTGSRCSQMDTLFDSGCMKHLQTWRCDDPSRPTPSDTLRLSDTYTLVSSDYDPAPCQSLDDSPSCSIAESQCVSTSPDTPLPPGIDPSQAAPDDCYRKQNTYACLTGQTDSSECDGYASNPDCTQQSSTCSDTFGNQCVLEQRTYQCMSRPPQTNTVTDCSGQLFCQNGHCFDTGYTNDTDFAQAMALMEAAREAGVYGEFGDGVSIFSGAESKCRIKLFGLANCCKKSSSGGGYSNSTNLKH